MELPKTYEPDKTEPNVYRRWLEAKAFHADPDGGGKRYGIVIPPPNVTDRLHVGHALNNVLQDILIRFRRMGGFNTLWMPGTDHAGIATQTVVEKRILAEEGKRRTDFAREDFVARVQAWKDEYEADILSQLKAMGCSCDWDRTRFTMDEVCAAAVRAAFFRLFADGLIYRGKRLVNWDPATQTVLADDEVEYETVQGHFWYLRYPLVEPVDVCSTGILPVGSTGILPVGSTGVPPVGGGGTGVSPVGSTGILPVGSTGVPPVDSPDSVPATGAEEAALRMRQGARLPHWTREGGTYSVTFRLGDSLPEKTLERWRTEREEILERARRQNRELTRLERGEVADLFSTRVDAYLDAGQGACYMKDPRIADVVRNALLHFDGERYAITAWCVMPNHVHVIVHLRKGNELSDILHSWKSFSAKEANRILGRTGQFWQVEYYDHLIRDEDDFIRAVQYVLDNSGRAGLKGWAWVGRANREDWQSEEHGQDAHATKSSNLPHGQDAHATHGQDARATKSSNLPHGQDAHATHGQDARATITYVTVATTRPETMLGDTAVAINPADPRAEALLGKKVRLPIVGRIIPIIADDSVVLPDPDSADEKARFSTGFLKVTPAHDPTDEKIGQRHGLPVVNVLAPDATISDRHGWDDCTAPEARNLVGMDRFEAREAVVDWFRKEGLLEDVRPYAHEVGHSYRSHVPIEPYLSDQWFIAVKKPFGSTGVPPVESGTRQPASAKASADKQATDNDQRPTTPKEPRPEGSGAVGGADVEFIEGTDVPVSSLAGLALKPLLDGDLRFVPERYANTYRAWLENLRDWPISRQLWWGHRIPVWRFHMRSFAQDTGLDAEIATRFEGLRRELMAWAESLGLHDALVVTRTRPTYTGHICARTPDVDAALSKLRQATGFIRPDASQQRGTPRNDLERRLAEYVDSIDQDPDVLDTWFSSALWPISTMGWPEETDLLKAFYPTDVLCTAREIITLWVSRMVMFGQYFRGRIPFRDVYIHAMIQDGQGRKMSKSLGNGIDPLDIIASHGADALRFTLASMSTETQDVRMPVEEMTLPDGRKARTSPKFDLGRNFCNKLWNAARFALMNLQATPPWSQAGRPTDVSDRWILSRLNDTVRQVTGTLENYRFHDAAGALYRYMWNDFCDWYLEIVKVRLAAGETACKAVLAHALDVLLRLLHPLVPFVTEEIWSHLNETVRHRGPSDSPAEAMLVRAAWPQAQPEWIDPVLESRFAGLQELVSGIREARSRHNVAPGRKVSVTLQAGGQDTMFHVEQAALIQALAGVESLRADRSAEPGASDATVVVGATRAFVHGVVDRQAELDKLTKRRQTLQRGIASAEGKLANAAFLQNAPPEVVALQRQRLGEMREELSGVEKSLSALG